jgi:hypothetical protein
MYLLFFNPISRTSKYCWDSNPLNFPEEKQVIRIEKGKITKIVKKAKLAGRLKLIMVSKEGDRINPKEIVGEKANFSVRFYANWLLDTFDATFFAGGDDFNDGEIVVYCLKPCKYDIEMDFDGLGIVGQKFQNVEVEKEKTNELKVTVDLNDPTGVQGVVSYENGTLLDNVEVSIGGPEGSSEILTAMAYTDIKGYYKIVGLKEGVHSVSFNKEIRDGVYLNLMPRNVNIKKGSLSRLDVRIKNPK